MTKKKTCEELPDLIEELIPTWQKGVEDINAKAKANELTAADLHLSMKLAETMMGVYARYRVLKVELKEEAKRESYKLNVQFPIIPLNAKNQS